MFGIFTFFRPSILSRGGPRGSATAFYFGRECVYSKLLKFRMVGDSLFNCDGREDCGRLLFAWGSRFPLSFFPSKPGGAPPQGASGEWPPVFFPSVLAFGFYVGVAFHAFSFYVLHCFS